MNSKERMIAAFKKSKPDRLPVTTHHVMPYFLNTYLGGIDNMQFFNDFALDPIQWVYDDSYQEKDLENWKITWESVPNEQYATWRYTIATPAGNLTAVLQSNQYTTWCSEALKRSHCIFMLTGQWHHTS